MQIQTWNPWSIFDELERGLFAAAGSQEWPVFDIDDDDDATTLTADVPGMTCDDIELTIAGATLTVRGERNVKSGQARQPTWLHGRVREAVPNRRRLCAGRHPSAHRGRRLDHHTPQS